MLETLPHIKECNLTDSGPASRVFKKLKMEAISARELILFGYLSRTCPRLQELHPKIPELDMSL
jgi:hypothetical protein